MDELKFLYKFELELAYGLCVGLFKATSEEIKAAVGKRIYIPDGGGKYADIIRTLEEGDITLVSSDPYIVKNVPEIGYDPLEYLEDSDTDGGGQNG